MLYIHNLHNPNPNPNKEGDGLIIVIIIIISIFLEKKTKAQRDQVITWSHMGSMWWSQDLNPDVLAEKSVPSTPLHCHTVQKEKKCQHSTNAQERKKRILVVQQIARAVYIIFTILSTQGHLEIRYSNWLLKPFDQDLYFSWNTAYQITLLEFYRVGLGCSLSKGQFDQKVFTWKECGRLPCFLYAGIFSLNSWEVSVHVTFHVTWIREDTYIILIPFLVIWIWAALGWWQWGA